MYIKAWVSAKNCLIFRNYFWPFISLEVACLLTILEWFTNPSLIWHKPNFFFQPKSTSFWMNVISKMTESYLLTYSYLIKKKIKSQSSTYFALLKYKGWVNCQKLKILKYIHRIWYIAWAKKKDCCSLFYMTLSA